MSDALRQALDRFEEECLLAFKSALQGARQRLEQRLTGLQGDTHEEIDVLQGGAGVAAPAPPSLPAAEPEASDTLADVPIAALQQQLAAARVEEHAPKRPGLESLHDVSPADIAKFRDKVRERTKSQRLQAADLGKLGEQLQALEGLQKTLEDNGFAFPTEMLGFINKSRRLAAGMSPAERDSPKGAKILVDVLRFVEGLAEFCLAHPRKSSLDTFSLRLAEHWVMFLEKHNVEVFPVEPPSDLGRLLHDSGSTEARPLGSEKPQGTPLALLRRGFRVGAKVRQKAVVSVSAGSDGGLSVAIARAHAALVTARPYGVGPTTVENLVELQRYQREVPAGDEEKRILCARFALNLIVRIDEASQLRSERKSLLNWLGERGYYEIPARVGDTFDDSYKPSKFERRLVSADRPTGEIVRVLQVGLVNRVGVAVQKTVLGVSDGRG